MDVVNTLNYAPVPHRYLRWQRRAFWLVGFAGIFAVVCLWGPGTARWIQFVYWQHRCLTYTAPPNRLVDDEDLRRGQILIPDIPDRQRFEQLAAAPTDPTATIFVHEMHTPSGSTRLVSISLRTINVWAPGYFGTPARWMNTTAFVLDVGNTANLPPLTAADHVKIFAGQIDPHDPSHMTFDCEINGHRHTVDCWLGDQDKVLMSPRP